MAEVVILQERLARPARRQPAWHDVPAEILLFTGVRYERLTPAMMAQKASVSGKNRGAKQSVPVADPARQNP
ncbi:hypothetical protein [Sinorhizobium sp. BG8]|uniref:hypothetical protein n=1 Tax=Sinorhizobium sp. BG8 TaxID=2613773 RepID=UPI00193DF71D|nr:hypothetical protein [Sinorhizobium sp. BG8]QRM54700.1 hypothetical protein F3Y30_09210 [Sinorhizobium sp. BG8]